jgi:hypothetical protein
VGVAALERSRRCPGPSGNEGETKPEKRTSAALRGRRRVVVRIETLRRTATRKPFDASRGRAAVGGATTAQYALRTGETVKVNSPAAPAAPVEASAYAAGNGARCS